MFTNVQLGNFGRLGNQLFQVAAVIGAAARYRTGYALPPWPVSQWMAGHPFPILNRLEGWQLYDEPHFQYTEIPPPAKEGTSLRGYFQSWRYFDHCLGQILSLFRPSPETLARAIAKLPGFTGSEDTAAIHIRRGDYLFSGGFHTNLEETGYYDAAINEASGSRTKWYVFSDDPLWCSRKYQFPGVEIVRPDPEPYVDLVAMSLCKCNVIANSSFSWWAAMLNSNPNARIYCPEPSDWFGASAVSYDTRDLLPPSWMRLRGPKSCTSGS